LSLDVLSLS